MTTLRPFRSALFACLLSTFASLPAQDPVTPPAGSQAAAAAAPNLKFAFQGGTFGELCALLGQAGEQVGGNVNIVIEPDAATVALPKVQVQDAGLAQVLEAACAIASSEDRSLHVKELRGSGSPVFAIVARLQSQPGGASAAAAATRVVTAVHSLGALLKDVRGVGFAPETILSAIETATVELPLRALRYHTDSRLLIVRGTSENLRVVAELLKELEQDVRRQEQQRKAAEAHPGGGAGKAGGDQPNDGAAKDEAKTR
ncbi:MAG: hypothetical protein ACK5UQ_14115 [Planctomycetota bacterium]